MRLSPSHIIVLAMAFGRSATTSIFAEPRSLRDAPMHMEFARSETYRYPTLELSLLVNKWNNDMFLLLQCPRTADAPPLHYQDFKIHVFDDRHEEVPCQTESDAVSFSAYNQLATGLLAMSIKPGHIPATASIWYQGYERIFTFKLKANEAIK